MKTTVLRASLLLMTLVALAPAADARSVRPRDQAIRISAFGIGPAAQPEVLLELRSIIGRHIAADTIHHFSVDAYGIEGGGEYCIQLAPYAPASSLWEIYDELAAVPFDPDQMQVQLSTEKTCELEHPIPGDGPVCAAVMTAARNLETGECQVFPSSCLPDGWIATPLTGQPAGSSQCLTLGSVCELPEGWEPCLIVNP